MAPFSEHGCGPGRGQPALRAGGNLTGKALQLVTFVVHDVINHHTGAICQIIQSLVIKNASCMLMVHFRLYNTMKHTVNRTSAFRWCRVCVRTAQIA
jgi:hypothetical protein